LSYIEKNLIPGEKLVYRTGLHWSVLVWPMFIALVLIGGAVACLLQKAQAFLFAGIFLLVVAGIVAMSAIIKRKGIEIAVTDRRVMIKTGMASRRSLEIMLPKVESVGIEETMMARALGYGTVVIRGTGGTPEPFQKIAHPAQLRMKVQEQVDAATRR
jgi:uncharacterized membrane protein YdbT with pleckstrin-like domain